MPKVVLQVSKLALQSTILLLLCLASNSARAELTASLSDGKPLKLLGIGMHQELRNDIYVGALFAPASISSVDQLRDDTIAKRMSIRLVAKYSHRKMARHWKERLAMNNDRALWRPFTKEIVEFSRIFKRGFTVGDEMNIDHLPGVGTQIYLNGTLFQSVDKKGFIDLLLNVWLGANPPTKAFGKSIRGEDTAANLESFAVTYQALQPIKGRFDDDLDTETQVASLDSEEKPSASEPKDTKQADTKKPAASKPEAKKAQTNVAKATPKKSTNDSNKKAADIKAPPVIKPDIKIDNAIASNIKPKSTPKKKAEEPKKVASLDKKSEKAAEAEDDFFDMDLISGSYKRELLTAIKLIQEYPRKAQMNGEQGEILAKVVINAKGEVLDVDLIERSDSRILNRAVIKMVNKASPYQPIPKELNVKEFEFEVPFSFQL